MPIHPVRFDNPEKGAKLRLAPFLFGTIVGAFRRALFETDRA